MKFTAVVAALFIGAAVAQDDQQSKPFHLQLKSSNKKLNGKQVSACHTGAAIESLCIADKGAKLYFNTTKNTVSPVKGYSKPGTLVFNLPLGNSHPDHESEGMSFTYDPATNVALPLFEPGYGETSVVFSKDTGSMGVVSYLDDTVTPPTGQNAKVLKNWYACQTYYVGYQYQNLGFVVGNGKPQNPSCVKVDVVRKFI